MITDVFPPYVVYITAFDALIVLPFLYKSYRVQEVLTEFRSGLQKDVLDLCPRYFDEILRVL